MVLKFTGIQGIFSKHLKYLQDHVLLKVSRTEALKCSKVRFSRVYKHNLP